MADVKSELTRISGPLRAQWLRLLQEGLRDDSWEYDWTAIGTLAGAPASVEARIVAKSTGVWAGSGALEAVAGLTETLGGEILVSQIASDGDRFKPGDVMARMKGSPRLILAVERPLLNLASYVSGIATRTRDLVGRAEKACPKDTPRITGTRKTLPGYRDLAVYGVVAGGGHSHRVSLAGGVLIKENHVAAAGSVGKAVEGARASAPHGLKIEIEVRDLAELEQALAARADGVLLDNFTPEQARAALARLAKESRPMVVEISGGITEESVASYALAGVDVLSVGSLTHSVKSVDLSLLVD